MVIRTQPLFGGPQEIVCGADPGVVQFRRVEFDPAVRRLAHVGFRLVLRWRLCRNGLIINGSRPRSTITHTRSHRVTRT